MVANKPFRQLFYLSEQYWLETYQLHAQQIDAAVRRRVSGGSVEPVMVRDYDLHESVGKGIE